MIQQQLRETRSEQREIRTSSVNPRASKVHQTSKRKLRTTTYCSRASCQQREARKVERLVDSKELATKINVQQFEWRVRQSLGKEKKSQNRKVSLAQRVGNIVYYTAGIEKRTASYEKNKNLEERHKSRTAKNKRDWRKANSKQGAAGSRHM